MRNRTLGILGLVLLIVGLCGAAVAAALVLVSVVDSDQWFDAGNGSDNGGGTSEFDGTYDTIGERIYYLGEDSNGDEIPRTGGFGMMSNRGCAFCHGEDGQGGVFGGMMGGRLNVPDIRYSTLSAPHEEEGVQEEGWTDEDIARAIRDGDEPNGDELSRYMPRWDMDDEDMRELIDYLKELE